MNKLVRTIAALALTLTACSQGARQPASNVEKPDNPALRQAPQIPPPGTGPDARTPLGAPKAAVDPKSPEAARGVVRRYGALIKDGRWSEAQELWNDANAAAAVASKLKSSHDLHLETLPPTEPEGAAGSIYVTVPVTLYAYDGPNAAFRQEATIILRRVNDVPGSTSSQRRWHIERVDWASRH
jgi:hypothetical protein